MNPTNLTPTNHHLLDLAGVDGLQVMRHLIGQPIECVAPFQSIETTIGSHPCSILRLCEGNFRMAWQGDFDLQQAIQATVVQKRVWVKQLSWLSVIVLSNMDLNNLLTIAVPKPPYRLQHLPMHCAIPARIDRLSVLIWRHHVQGQPAFELHAATVDLSALQAKLLAHSK